MSRTLTSLPAADGFRMPAEFEPHSGTWMAWPERPDNWRLGAKPAQEAFARVAEVIAESEPVTMAVSDRQFDHARSVLSPAVRVVELSTNDSWMRDIGPTFVVDGRGDLRGVDWVFNAWGGLDGGLYFPWDLDDRAALKASVRTPSGVLEVRGASANNLQHVDVDMPLGVLVVVTGVAGAGKSSLIHGSVSGRDGVVSIDQGGIRGSRRSNPATYTGLLDPIRKAFAKANGVKPALFSANSDGACPNCNGAGVIYTDLAMMAGVATTCEECEGKRFQASVLDYHLGGRDISEVLAMSVTEAEEFFGAGEARTPAAHAILDRLADVGLGYLSLGQPLTTLSGGERQRLKLATHLAEKGGVYVLDEPTTGLHLADVEQLLGLLDRLVDSGRSVIVISHHQAVMAHADWIIDLGPGAGHDGGRIVFEGAPADLVAARPTLTGEHLAAYVGT